MGPLGKNALFTKKSTLSTKNFELLQKEIRALKNTPFARQFAPLITNGPAGLAGYAQGRPVVRSIYSYWPTTVSRAEITPKVTVQTADEWADTEST